MESRPGVSHLESRFWVPMAEQAVNVIYSLAEHPDAITASIIKNVAKQVVLLERFPLRRETEGEGPLCSPESPTKGVKCPTAYVTRLLSLVGHTALRQLIHLDVSTFGEMKRRHQMQEGKGAKQGTSASARNRSKNNGSSSDDEEDDMGIGGAIAEDAEAEFILKVTEKEVVGGEGLLAALQPLLVGICSNQSKYPDPELQAAASLALAKYMLVSSEFCESHLQLLFTILERSPHAVIRANTIIAMGDLTFRFPNLIEPWTPNLYAR